MKTITSIGKTVLRAFGVLIVLTSLFLSFAPNPEQVDAAWLGTWENRIKIRVDYSKVDSELTNFPAMVHICDSAGTNGADMTPVFDELQSDANRKKIAVTTSDGQTQTYVEIEKWNDTSEDAVLWILIPTINFGSETELYLYYDADQTDNTTYVGDTGDAVAQNVWNSDFEGVYHLAGDYDGTADEVKDSTDNGRHGQGGGGTESQAPTQTASVIGYGQYFDGDADCDPPAGSDQYIELVDADAFSIITTDELMYEVWLDFTTLELYTEYVGPPYIAQFVHVLGKCQLNQEEWLLTVGGEHAANPWSIRNYVMNLSGGSGESADTSEEWEIGDKFHVYAWFDAVAEDIFIDVWYPDGSHTLFHNPSWGSLTPENGTAPVCLGGHANYNNGDWWEGTFDEFRILNSNQDADWRKADHYSQIDDLLYYGEGGGVFPQLYESDKNDNDNAGFGGTYWLGQTFTPQTAHTIQYVKMKLKHYSGTDTGNLNIAIYAADGEHKPTGSSLATGSVPISSLNDSTLTVTTITLTEADLSASTEYVIVMSAPDMGTNDITYAMEIPGTYPGGGMLTSSDSGSTWGTGYYSTRDLYFEDWGVPLASTPSVTTSAATNIASTSAMGNGNITDDGGETITERGFEWDTDSGAPYANSESEEGTFGEGEYSLSLTGLPSGTTIYYRAFATNSEGTGYGSELNFLTIPAAPTNVSATDGDYTDKVVITWTKSTGATGYKVYEGENLLDTLGDVDTYDDTDAPAPTITPGSAVASDGTSSEYVELSLDGASVSNGASRTYKVIAFNATGDSDPSDTDTGYRGHGDLTYQWQRSAADSDENYSNIEGATTATYQDTEGVETPDGRYYKCVLNATGAAEQTSTGDRGYKSASSSPPEVSSLPATDVYMNGGTHATLNGSLDDLSGFPDADIWFEWGYSDIYGNVVGERTVTETGDYYYELTGFNPDREIFFRFAGENDDGVSYGDGLTCQIGAIPIVYTTAKLFPFLGMFFIIATIGSLIYSRIPAYATVIIVVVFLFIGTIGIQVLMNPLHLWW